MSDEADHKPNLELASEVSEAASNERLLLAIFFATNATRTHNAPNVAEDTLLFQPCCVRCAARLLGLRIFSLFSQPETTLLQTLLHVAQKRGLSSFEPPLDRFAFPSASSCSTLPRSSVCGLCLGILQGDEDLSIKVVKRNDPQNHPDTTISEDVSLPPRVRILHSLQACRHQYRTFQFNITMPQSIYIRQSAFLSAIQLVTGNPSIFSDTDDPIVEVKEAIKWMLGQKMDSKFEPESAFTIKLNFQHADNRSEIMKLLAATNTEPPKKKRKRSKGKKHPSLSTTTSSSSSSSSSSEVGSNQRDERDEDGDDQEKGDGLPETLDLLPFADVSPLVKSIRTIERFLSTDILPITNPLQTCTMSITYEHTYIYIAGRYNKYTRKLSQTPWVIDGKRKTESSIEELTGIPSKDFFDADSFTFMAAGREDVDVRMLGSGRPFILELHNPRRALRPSSDCAELQETINAATKLIKVRDLQIVSRQDTDILKEGEEKKRKTYRCLVQTSRPLQSADYEMLLAYRRSPDSNSAPDPDNQKAVLTLNQETPIRVLHRRSLSIRPKEIYNIVCTPINDHFLFVDVETQAGTYVKEFIHGDLGRTVPSFGSLVKCRADILSLDVISIKMDFPPRFLDRDDDGGESPPELFPIDFVKEDELSIIEA